MSLTSPVTYTLPSQTVAQKLILGDDNLPSSFTSGFQRGFDPVPSVDKGSTTTVGLT